MALSNGIRMSVGYVEQMQKTQAAVPIGEQVYLETEPLIGFLVLHTHGENNIFLKYVNEVKVEIRYKNFTSKQSLTIRTPKATYLVYILF